MDFTLRLRFLGTVQVERDGKPVRGLRSRKALALLGYLAAQERPVPREHLANLFWEDQTESRARANLSWVMNRLTPALPGCLQADRHTVQFCRTEACWLDLDVFKTLEARGDVVALNDAVELYRGEFLQGLSLRGCAEFEIWLVGERERWQERVARALEKLITHHSQRGEFADGLRVARQLLTLEPWREEAHRQTMLLLARSGQRSAALAQYETCRRVLADELRVEPMPETIALYERILEEAAPPAEIVRLTAPMLPFVGRGDTYAQLLADWQACRRGARLTLVEGEAGMGKTRLVEEVLAQTQMQGALVTRGQCVEFAAEVPYRPLVEALRQILESQQRKPFSAQARLGDSIHPVWLAELTHLLPELRERYPDLPQPLAAQGEAARQRLFEAVARYVRACCQSFQPTVHGAALVFFLDDLHWADRATLDLLHYVVETLADSTDSGIWFVGAYRPEETPLAHPLTRLRQNLARADLARCVPLTPLSAPAVKEIAVWLSDDPSLESFLARESGGNPFILTEVLKELQDTHRLQLDPAGRWIVTGDLTEETLPERVEDLALQRVGRLPAEAQRLLDFAAVIGEPFAPTLLSDVVGEPADALGEVLALWQARRLLEPDEAGRYAFVHDKIAEAIYHHLASDLRKLLHERVGQTLIDRAAGGSANAAPQIAYHLERCLAPRRAAPYLKQAAEAAQQVYAHQTALGYYQRLLPLVNDPERVEVWEAIGRVWRTQAQYAQALEAFNAMLQVAERIGDPTGQARALIGIASAQERLGDLHTTLESARRAEGLARAAGASARIDLVHAVYTQGVVYYRMGDEHTALRLGEQALALCAELGPAARVLMARSLSLLGNAHVLLGNFASAAQHHTRALALNQEMGNRAAIASNLNDLGETARLQGEFQRAVDYYRQALTTAREIGARVNELVFQNNLGGALAAQGEYTQAEAELRVTSRACEAANQRITLAYAHLFLAEALLGQERIAEALTAAQRALELGQAQERQDQIGITWRALGKIAARLPRPVAIGDATYDAAACFAESLRICDAARMEAERAWTLRAWAQHERTRGDPARGEALRQQAREIFTRLEMVWSD